MIPEKQGWTLEEMRQFFSKYTLCRSTTREMKMQRKNWVDEDVTQTMTGAIKEMIITQGVCGKNWGMFSNVNEDKKELQ